METADIERVERTFKQRYEQKKIVNVAISAVIAILGVASVIYIWNFDGDGMMTFRWLTVDGTIFTTAIAIFYVVISIYEMIRYTELTWKTAYYLRLGAAVTESLIVVVVLLSQLPFAPDHMHIFRFDMFNMHIVIPVLMVLSFIVNDSPIGKFTAGQKIHGTCFVTLYAIVILTLIVTDVVPYEMIPYFFLDVFHMPVLTFIGYFLVIHAIAYVLTHFIVKWNQKLSWIWFKDIGRR